MNQLGRCQQRFVEILQLSKRLQEFLQFHDQDLDGPKKLKIIINYAECVMTMHL